MVEVERVNLNDDYLICPNDLFRGHGVYSGLDELARLWLGAGLSCRNRYETTLAEIEGWLPSVGRDRHEAIRRQLREQGFLTMRRDKMPAGHPKAGKFIWAFKFFMNPLPPEQRDELQPKKQRERREKAAPMPGSSGHGDAFEQVSESAGGAMPGSSGHGRPGHGAPGPGGQGDVYKEEKNHSLEEQDPLPLGDPLTGGDPLDAKEGGEDSEPEIPTDLDRFAAWFAQRRPDWDNAVVIEALDAAVNRGHGDLRRCASALRELAEGKHGETSSPRRLLVREGPWWANPEVPRPTRDRRLGPRCTTYGHGREPADGCLLCRAERLGRDDEPELTDAERAAGERMVRAILAQRGQRRVSALAPA